MIPQRDEDNSDVGGPDSDGPLPPGPGDDGSDDVILVKAQPVPRGEVVQPSGAEPVSGGACHREKPATDRVGKLVEMTDDEATWPATCAYFGHNPDERDGTIDHGVVLPGTKRKLRPVQMQDVYRTLKLATAKTTTDRGALLAHEMGVGKTMIYQAIIAVRRLAILSDQHARDHPEEHASATG
ncbi:hypothetical protein CSUB01_12626, partial [Colletotrichum sublineola]